MKTHWLIIWRWENVSYKKHTDRLIVGSVYVSGNPQGTHDFQQLNTLGDIYGFITYIKSAEVYLENAPDDNRLTYEQVHKDIWHRLGQRKILLAMRRKKA